MAGDVEGQAKKDGYGDEQNNLHPGHLCLCPAGAPAYRV